MIDIDKSVKWITSICNDDTHGYSQDNRYGPDYDCSSLVTAALRVGGADIPETLTTRDMLNYLRRVGYEIVNDKKIQKGDVFLAVRYHVVMAVDSKNVATASIDEQGTIVGKKQGDQTGKEIYIRSFYTPSYGWDYHLRYQINEVADDYITIAYDVIRGYYGNGVQRMNLLGAKYNDVQRIVNIIIKYGDSYIAMARDVIRGKYGNGQARKKALGDKYDDVQFLVNMILKG